MGGVRCWATDGANSKIKVPAQPRSKKNNFSEKLPSPSPTENLTSLLRDVFSN